jgi:ABC-type transport system involved in multi-copper enzyme maturation permease subunit
MSAVMAIARLSWKRLWRSKGIWITAILLMIPILLAGLTIARMASAADRWTRVAELTLRSLILIAPVLHLAPALGEEYDAKTYTYLWSRPISRVSMLFGKMLAVTPVLLAGTLLSLSLGFAIVSAGAGETDFGWLPPVLCAAAVGIVAASAFSIGVGTLFPRYQLVIALAYVFFAEQVLPEVPAIQSLSTLYHVKQIAALPYDNPPTESVGSGILQLALLTVVWLALATWRIARKEYSGSDA